MGQKLQTYTEKIVENHLKNDAGILYVRDNLKGHPNVWLLAVWGYARTMGTSDKNYGLFRKRWAWTEDRVQKYMKSSEGTALKQHLKDLMKHFSAQTGMKDYALEHGELGRSIDKQIQYYRDNWSVKLLSVDLEAQLNKELEKYPDTPAKQDIAKFYDFIRKVTLSGVDNPATKKKESVTSPTNATPGLSDHGRMSAIDFVVKKNGKHLAGASNAEISVWRAPRDGGLTFESALQSAVVKLNSDSGGDVFSGPLKSPDEPWHYTYIPLMKTEEKKTDPSKTTD